MEAITKRLRIDPGHARQAGEADAIDILCAPAGLQATMMLDRLAEVVGLASESRLEEARARLEGFCYALAPIPRFGGPGPAPSPARRPPPESFTETEGGSHD